MRRLFYYLGAFLDLGALMCMLFMPLNAGATASPASSDTMLYANSGNIYSKVKGSSTANLLISNSTYPGAAAPMLLPDRTQFYFTVGTSYWKDVYRADVDGTNVTAMGFTLPNFVNSAALSSDGSKIVYLDGYWYGSDSKQYNAVTIRTVATGATTSVHTPIVGNMEDVTWTTSGQLLFRFIGVDTNDQVNQNTCYLWIAKMNTDGTGFTKLTADNANPTAGNCAYPTDPRSNPVDGAIVYTLSRNPFTDSARDATGHEDLYVMNADGSNNGLLYAGAVHSNAVYDYYGYLYGATWSPNGNYVVTSYNNPNDTVGYRLATINVPTKVLLDTGPTLNGTIADISWGTQYTPPTLASDHLLYTTNSGISSIKSDATDSKLLVDSGLYSGVTSPMITPDRMHFYFLSGTSYWMNVYEANIDGAGIVKLNFTLPNFVTTGALSPDGTKIVYLDGYWYGSDSKQYNAVTIRDLAANTIATSIHTPISGDMQDVSWTNGGQLLFRFVGVDNNDQVNQNTCYLWIAKMNTDGTGFTKLSADNPNPTAGNCAYPMEPRSNPVNGKIVYSLTRNPYSDGTRDATGHEDLYVMNADGSNNSLLYAGPVHSNAVADYYGYVFGAIWSPDGSYIATSYNNPNDSVGIRLAIINADTGALYSTGPSVADHQSSIAW